MGFQMLKCTYAVATDTTVEIAKPGIRLQCDNLQGYHLRGIIQLAPSMKLGDGQNSHVAANLFMRKRRRHVRLARRNNC